MRAVHRVWAGLAVLALASPWAAAQSTVYVDASAVCPCDGSSTKPYKEIQTAICAIKDTGGGTVLVRPGAYNEAVRMFFGVSVISTHGPLETTINPTSPAVKSCVNATCGDSGVTPCAAVYFPSSAGGGGSSNADRLEGFTITGGRGIKQTCSGSCNAQAGGGIFVLNSSPTITRNTISGNVLNPANVETEIVFRGGGIYVGSSIGTPSRPVISLNTIEGNVADSAPGTNARPNFSCGGGIYVDERSAPVIEANLIRNNRSGLASKAFQYGGGGGVAVYTNTSVALPRTVVTRNHITGNQSADLAGGVAAAFLYTSPSASRIENNLIELNTSDEGGGLATLDTAAEIVNNTITDNTAAGGAGISFGRADLAPNSAKLANNLITFNVASVTGGGIYFHPTLNPTVKKNDIHGSTPNQIAGSKTDAQIIGVNGNVNVNPNYVSRVAGNRNLRVQPGSPVIDLGDNADAGGNDLDNTARVQDGDANGVPIVDMGGFEFPAADFDGDGTPDVTDPDDDNDGVLDGGDCGPQNRAVSVAAGEPGGLRLSKVSGAERLRWNRGAQGHTSNVYRGEIVPGQPWSYTMTCLSNESPVRQADDPAVPPVGHVFYYLIAGKNSCGESRAGSTHTGAPVVPPDLCSTASRETDGDTLLDLGDNCPITSNASQDDEDGDWAGDACDNCAGMGNSSQANLDDDLRGDACDNCPAVPNDSQVDGDTDLVGDACDNCPASPNQDQANNDLDTQGDVCDPDDDNDTVLDASDNCPLTPNPSQADNDLDTLGDLCDPDDDNDTVGDLSDNCPLAANPSQENLDGDIPGDACDNCPATPNSSQVDADADGRGDVCDNCPAAPNPAQDDHDGDAQGDVCDPDDDNDLILDGSDNCPVDANTGQENWDGDPLGDACDPDDDNDLVLDGADNCPLLSNSGQEDADTDGQGDACDPDDDNDTVLDASDNCPVDANAGQEDNDADSLGDACDPDDDNDLILDGSDNCPVDANTGQENWDGDPLGDVCDPDDDNDLVLDGADNCPLLSNSGQEDADTDGQGDACDPDDDNDTVLDAADNCPLHGNPGQEDNDTDALGDACDPDDDNDTVADAEDCAPLDPSASDLPLEVSGLTLTHAGGTQLSWTGQGPGILYDVVGGSLEGLRGEGNVGSATCLVNDETASTWLDPRPDPAPEQGHYYLSRGQNACGTSGYGTASSGAPRLPAVDCP